MNNNDHDLVDEVLKQVGAVQEKRASSVNVFREFLAAKKYRVTLQGIKKGNRLLKSGAIEDELWEWIDQHPLYSKIKVEIKNHQSFAHLMNLLRERLKQKTFETLRRQFQYNPKFKNSYEKYWATMTRMMKFSELEREVLYAWLFAVKYAIFNQELCPFDVPLIIIYAPAQNAQKSTFVHALLLPLGEFVAECNQFVLNDRFGLEHFLESSLVCFFDEMAAVNAESAAGRRAIKFLLTSRRLHARGAHTDVVGKIRRLAQFIGTSQHPIREIFRDDTGQRRFFQIALKMPFRFFLDWIKCDWGTFKDTGFMKMLWQSVDLEKWPRFATDEAVKAEFMRVNDRNFRYIGQVEEWFAQAGDMLQEQTFKAKELYLKFNSWYKENHGRASLLSLTAFAATVRHKLDRYIKYVSYGKSHTTAYHVHTPMPDDYLVPEEKDILTKARLEDILKARNVKNEDN